MPAFLRKSAMSLEGAWLKLCLPTCIPSIVCSTPEKAEPMWKGSRLGGWIPAGRHARRQIMGLTHLPAEKKAKHPGSGWRLPAGRLRPASLRQPESRARTELLPMPSSPSIASTPPLPARAASTAAKAVARSGIRPTNGVCSSTSLGPRPRRAHARSIE